MNAVLVILVVGGRDHPLDYNLFILDGRLWLGGKKFVVFGS